MSLQNSGQRGASGRMATSTLGLGCSPLPKLEAYQQFCKERDERMSLAGAKQRSKTTIWRDPARLRRLALALRGNTPMNIAAGFNLSASTISVIMAELPKELR